MFACDAPQYSAQKPLHTLVVERRVRREPEVVRVVRDQVALAAELRDPERVRSRPAVFSVKFTVRPIGRYSSLAVTTCRRVRGLRGVLRIAELPPPLVADHLDLQRVGRRLRLRLEDRADGRDGDEDQDDRRDRVHRISSVVFPCTCFGSSASLRRRNRNDRVEQDALDEDEDERAPEEELVPQRLDRRVELGRVVERRVGVVLAVRAARGDGQRESGE